ncbi:RNA-directed DNA polymerase from mobile element jockey-like [Rhizophagus clarus]|uniref:RNA-directed DNA polymerase from mobile element jockey-like n=1 Tax=Rhizophagus clarus TaxID=94130 RepID=A0A8H3QIW9_9GLOM|nr:RNA-directed DNA polymerase from mobile element jockey-like [Rhizophagus clarus]
MGITISREEVKALEGFGKLQQEERVALLTERGMNIEDRDREIGEFLGTDEVTGTLIRGLITLGADKQRELTVKEANQYIKTIQEMHNELTNERMSQYMEDKKRWEEHMKYYYHTTSPKTHNLITEVGTSDIEDRILLQGSDNNIPKEELDVLEDYTSSDEESFTVKRHRDMTIEHTGDKKTSPSTNQQSRKQKKYGKGKNLLLEDQSILIANDNEIIMLDSERGNKNASQHAPKGVKDFKYFAGIVEYNLKEKDQQKIVNSLNNEENDEPILPYTINRLGTTHNAHMTPYVYVGFHYKKERDNFCNNNHVINNIGKFEPLKWMDAVDAHISIIFEHIPKALPQAEIETHIEKEIGKIINIEGIRHNSKKEEWSIKAKVEVRCTEKKLIDTWEFYLQNGNFITVRPLNFRREEIDNRNSYAATIMSIGNEIPYEKVVNELNKITGVGLWQVIRDDNNKQDTYNVRVQFRSKEARREAGKHPFTIKDEVKEITAQLLQIEITPEDDHIITNHTREGENTMKRPMARKDAISAKKTTISQTSAETQEQRLTEIGNAIARFAKGTITTMKNVFTKTTRGITNTTTSHQPPEITDTIDTTPTNLIHNLMAEETTVALQSMQTEQMESEISHSHKEDQLNTSTTVPSLSHNPPDPTDTLTITTTTPTTTRIIDQEMIEEVQVTNKDHTTDTANSYTQRDRHPETDGQPGGSAGKRKLSTEFNKEEKYPSIKTKKRIKNKKNKKQIKIQKDHYKKDADLKQKDVNEPYNFKKYNRNLKIGCINIRRLNDSNNQLDLRRMITNEKWDIAIVSETKLNSRKGQHIYKDWTNYDSLNCSYNDSDQKRGIMIIIRKELSQRKVNIERINGHVIKFDLLFKKQKSIKIIGIYNPNQDKEMTNKIKRKIIDWIEEAERLQQELIILGDFNEADKATNRSNRLITKCLHNLNLKDINRCIAGDKVLDTWTNGFNSSRIDYIFTSDNILSNIIRHEVKKLENIQTDHKALTITIKLAEILEFDKNSMIKDIKKQKTWIKPDTKDWETIAATVEDQISKVDPSATINWNTLVEIYQNAHQEVIKIKKATIEEEIKAAENCSDDELHNNNPRILIRNLIAERDRLLYLEYMGHRIKKFLNKLLNKSYNRHCRETAKNFQTAKRMYNDITILPQWNEENMTDKRNKLKIESLVKLYNNKEFIEDKKLDHDKLRKPSYRKSFMEDIKKIEQLSNEMTNDIINTNIDINIRTRESYLENDIGKMIDRILERKREKIDMSNLFIKENGTFTIETDKEKIKERVHDHYKTWTRKRNIDLDLIEYNEEWRNIYQPRIEINEQIYDGILEDITLDELDNIIRETKSGKAAGISGIPYDFWKKSKIETRKILLDIYNRTLHDHKVLDDWKKGMIFPINKTTRSHWNNDINLTRPITLIKTARKIFIKILVKRLAKILSLNKVLQGSNYAALLNESTLEPLKIVQSIIEDANKENKEVWILLMDISKAFDSVSMIMLEKSLKRIKVPEPLINIIMDINLNRTNKVIVNGEFTKEYEVEDGVDQGEVWSPLLWRIFYDALLTRLAIIKNETGYTMETTKHIDINKNISKKIEITYNASAFMDDTTLIGGNKNKLMKMIEICHEFFEINDIKANIKKYELIRINGSEDNENNELIINNEKIEKVNNPEGNRFLGIYFRHDN